MMQKQKIKKKARDYATFFSLVYLTKMIRKCVIDFINTLIATSLKIQLYVIYHVHHSLKETFLNLLSYI